MFHQRDNLFVGRGDDGSVRLLKLNPSARPDLMSMTIDTIFPAHEVQMDVTIPWNEWCSMIATVSKTGESHFNEVLGKHKWYIAVDFHNS